MLQRQIKSLITIFTLLAGIGFSSVSYSKERIYKLDGDWKFSNSSIALGAKFQSVLAKRGATFYDSWQISPIWSIDLFHPSLQLVGTTLNYRMYFTDWLLFRTRFSLSATGDKPLYTTGVAKGPQNERDGSMELDFFLEFLCPKRGEVRLNYSQSLTGHTGSFFEAKLRGVVYNYELKKEMTIQPAITASIGFGTQSHNEYIYGSGASGFGASTYSFGVSVAAVPAIDHFYPVLEIERYAILGNGNQNASLVFGQRSGLKISLLMAFKII